MAQYPTDLASTELARKYAYVFNTLTQTWYDSNFAAKNLRRQVATRTNGGRQMIIALETAGSGSFTFNSIATAEPGTATYKEATIDFTTWSVGVQYNWQAKLAGQTDKLSFIQLRAKAVADAAEMIGLRFSHAIFLPKSGAIARLKTDLGGGLWQLYTESESGANGTHGSRYLFENGYTSASANTTGVVTELAFDGISTGVDRINDQVSLSGTGTASLVADTYLYWGTKVRTSKGSQLTGLPQIVNDGVDYAIFEGRDRTLSANIDWRSTVDRSFGTGNIEREMITQAKNLAKRRGGKKTDVVMYGLDTQLMHFEQMATQRRMMIPVTDMKTGPTFTGGFLGLPVDYGTERMLAIADREFPDNTMYGLNWGSLFLGMLTEPTWLNEGEGDFHWIPESYNWEAVLAAVGQLCSSDPALNWVTTGITPNA